MRIPKPALRILIVEDDAVRAAMLKELMPEGARVVHVGSAGAAIGTIVRDHGWVYAGVLLDHDLQQQTKTAGDRDRTGRDVARAIATHCDDGIPMLWGAKTRPRRFRSTAGGLERLAATIQCRSTPRTRIGRRPP